MIRPDDGDGGGTPADGGGSANPPSGGGTAGPGTGGGASQAAAQAQACNDICATWGTCTPTDDCVGDCVAEGVPVCFDEWFAYIECLADSFNGNCTQFACDAESDAYLACQDASTCESYGCSQDDTSCSCDGTCKNTTLNQVCDFSDGGMNIPCDCYENGSFFASCTMNGDACNIASGCCFELL